MDILPDQLLEFVDLCAKEYDSWEGDEDWDVFRIKKGNTQLMIAHLLGSETIRTVFRGTDDSDDWRLNINIFQRRLVLPYEDMEDSPVRVHSGFIKAWKCVRDEVIPYLLFKYEETGLKNFIFIGHSLGGALAQLASLDFQYHMNKLENSFDISCVTFGAPRVGNYYFKSSRDKRVPKTLNLINDEDPVFYQPWILLGYRRSGEVRRIGRRSRLWLPSALRIKSHYLTNYLTNLNGDSE